MPRDHLARCDREALAEELSALFGHDLGDTPPITGAQLSALRAYDCTPRLAELAGLPTLVVSARHDLIARPDSGRALAAGIPGARYVELPDAAHAAPILHAHEINELLATHLAEAETRREP